MSGFKAFVLKGNLVDLAVAVIIGTAFGAVVTKFTEWLTGLMPESASDFFSTAPQSFGAFLNASISFLILAAVVYFFVVKPYQAAKDRFFPDAPAEDPADIKLLAEIRDLLASQRR
ncbi:MAG: MscL family protein [Kineosporiaceae bacterium]|nr:MscL family protein [Kineosporiaceae bacterium]